MTRPRAQHGVYYFVHLDVEHAVAAAVHRATVASIRRLLSRTRGPKERRRLLRELPRVDVVAAPVLAERVGGRERLFFGGFNEDDNRVIVAGVKPPEPDFTDDDFLFAVGQTVAHELRHWWQHKTCRPTRGEEAESDAERFASEITDQLFTQGTESQACPTSRSTATI